MRKNTKKSSRVEIFLKNWLAFLWKYVLIQKNHQLEQVVIWNLTTRICPSPLAWKCQYQLPSQPSDLESWISLPSQPSWSIKVQCFIQSPFWMKNQIHGTLLAKSIKFFSAKSKKNPHWGDFYKIMTIFSWEFQWTFLDFPGLLRLSYIVPQKIQTNFLFHPCILRLVTHSVQVLRPQSPRAHPCH